MSQNPYCFIVGCPRSGTTLLQRLVDAHPLIAVPPETHWIPRWYEERRALTSEGLVKPALLSKLLAYDRFSELHLPREKVEKLLESSEPISYSTFVTGIFDLYGEARKKPLVGDKTPEYARRIPTLHALWPKAKFIHIIRDGRDVCLSYINWKKSNKRASLFVTWNQDPVSTVALWWETHVRLARESANELGSELYYEIRYEKLVNNPTDECKALCRFLGVNFDARMLQFHEGRVKTKPGLCAKRAWLPVTPGLRDWKTQMCVEDIERFEAATGDLLDELDYPRSAPLPKATRMSDAARIRELFTQAVNARSKDGASKGVTTRKAFKANKVHPHFFIVGCARSGTTLLQRIVDTHSNVAITPEIHWITNHFKTKQGALTIDGLVTRELIATLATHKRFSHLEISPEQFQGLLGSKECLSYGEFLSAYFGFYRTLKKKKLVGNKTPGYVRSISGLNALWPNAKFIHLVRDGRDVCLSVLNWKKAEHNVGRYVTWKHDPVSTVALWWKRNVKLGREVRNLLGSEHYFEMRYEDLVTDPAKALHPLCNFLGINYEDEMLRFYEGPPKTGAHFKGRRAAMPITHGLRNWRTQMSWENQEIFEAGAGELLDELGYERVFQQTSSERLRQATLIHQAFTEDNRARGHLLPQSW